MIKNALVFVVFAGMALMGITAEHAKSEPATIKRVTRPQTPRVTIERSDMVDVAVKDNSGLESIIRDSLRNHGMQISEGNATQSTVRVSILGGFYFGKPGAKTETGMLRDIPIHVNRELPEESLVTEGLKGRQLVLDTLVMRSISVSELLIYLSERSGIAGWFNKALTGDPRGVCLTSNCEDVETVVTLYVTVTRDGDSVSWTAMAGAKAKTIVLDQVLAAALDTALSPVFAGLQPKP